MTAESDFIAELTGSPQEERTAEEKALDRLRGWLERKTWSGARNPIGPLPWPENICLLAGLDPEASADADPAGWALLPGSLAFHGVNAFPRGRHGLDALRASVEEHVGHLLGLGLKTGDPAKAIKATLTARVVILWLDAARSDPACAALLPPEAFAVEGADGRSPFRKAQQKRRLKQHESSPKTKLILRSGREAFDKIAGDGFKGYLHEGPKRRGEVNVSAVATEVWTSVKDEPAAPDLRAVVNYVNEWLGELGLKKVNRPPADSETASADV